MWCGLRCRSCGDRATLHGGFRQPGHSEYPMARATLPVRSQWLALPGHCGVPFTWKNGRSPESTATSEEYGMQRYTLYIDSRHDEAASGQWFESYNPYTGAPWAQ